MKIPNFGRRRRKIEKIVVRRNVCLVLSLLLSFFYYQKAWYYFTDETCAEYGDLLFPAGIVLILLLLFSKKLVLTRILLAVTSVVWVKMYLNLYQELNGQRAEFVPVLFYCLILFLLNILFNAKQDYTH